MKSIHFICRGNTYRSRIAEAYSLSLVHGKGIASISSSGIEAKLALNGDIKTDTVELLKAEGIDKYLTPTWSQTTQKDIDENDIIVFMSQTLYAQANKMFKLPKSKVKIWNIPDVDGIYPIIKENVNELLRAEF